MENKDFLSLSPEDRRVEIAKDVLKQIEFGVFIPKGGDYINVDHFSGNIEDSAQEAIEKKQIICTGCAKGALFMSEIVFKNKLTIDELSDSDLRYIDNDEYENLRQDFSDNQLNMIECAFEGWDVQDALATGDKYSCISFYKEHSILDLDCDYSDEEKEESASIVLKAIMNNIIKNEGEFKP